MEKILIIDNHKGRWDYIVNQFPEIIDSGEDMADFFDFDRAGNYCYPKFDDGVYAYIFIHHSQRQDSMLSSTLLDLIIEKLGSKLVLFSGGINLSFLNTDMPERIFRSIPRETLQLRIKPFLMTSLVVNRWEINSLFYDYPRQLKSRLIVMLEDNTIADLMNSQEMKEFLLLVYVNPGSQKYKDLASSDEASFGEKLEMLLK